MGRPSSGGDTSVALLSSIALLQERFKQLERAKESREKRERTATAAAAPSAVGSSAERHMSWLFFQYPDLLRLPPPPPPVPRGLLLLYPEPAGLPPSGPAGATSWPPPVQKNASAADDGELDAVDTSLHL